MSGKHPWKKPAMPEPRTRDLHSSRSEQELQAARRVSEALSRHVNIDELVEEALLTALEVVEADAGSVLLYDPQTDQLVFRHVIGDKANLLKGTAIPSDQGIAGTVFTTGEPYVTTDARQDAHHLGTVDQSTGYQTRDMIAVPLKRWEGSPVGVLEVLNKRGGRLGEHDLSILTIIAALSAAAIEQARLFEETKLAQMVRLLADIGHDVSNLLTPVICGVGLLESNLTDFFNSLPEKDAAQAKSMRQLCDDVLGLLRTNSRRIQEQVKEMANCVKGLSTPPVFGSCQVALVVQHVLDTLRLLATENGIRLCAEGLDDLPSIMADERRLYLAFYNLVNNAIPEVPQGGTITVQGRKDPSEEAVEVSVADTGRGMPPEIRDRLFTPHAISRKQGGTGLGTKIVGDVVAAHGGQITVESKEGEGTTFVIRLPIHPPKKTRPKS